MPTNYQSNPNQKRIQITGKEPCNSNDLYMKTNKQALFNALSTLKPSALKVWLYLSSQQIGYTFDLSPAAVAAETGIPKSTIQEGVRELERLNYLVLDHGNTYTFYEKPKDI